jgi:UDP-glucose-4-epimerase GalE
MKVVVTGGCGYIGSHVARAFKLAGDQVTIIDRVQRDHTLQDIDGYYIDDFVSDGALSVLVHAEPDVIVHCAGTSLVGPSMDNPSEYWDNNVNKFIKFMDVVKTLPKRPTILFSSSASVYGEPEIIPVPETHRISPISPYGNTKATCERILHDYYLAYAVPSVCFRFFNAAGAEPHSFDLGQEPGATHIVARALEASINQQKFVLYGRNYPTPDGTCVRDYIHVWDLAQAHVAASRRAGEATGWVGAQRINLGTGKGISNYEIMNYVRANYGLPDIDTMAPRLGDPVELVARCDLARDWLNWTPKYSTINNIIDSAYRWYTRV